LWCVALFAQKGSSLSKNVTKFAKQRAASSSQPAATVADLISPLPAVSIDDVGERRDEAAERPNQAEHQVRPRTASDEKRDIELSILRIALAMTKGQ
jgi:hypothetical protein